MLNIQLVATIATDIAEMQTKTLSKSMLAGKWYRVAGVIDNGDRLLVINETNSLVPIGTHLLTVKPYEETANATKDNNGGAANVTATQGTKAEPSRPAARPSQATGTSQAKGK